MAATCSVPEERRRGARPRASNSTRKNRTGPSTSGVTIRGVTVPQPSRWNAAMLRSSAADRDPDQMADAIGDPGGGKADQELAQSGERQMAAGEERGAGPDQDQGQAAGGKARQQRGHAAQPEEGRNREDRAGGEEA